MYRSYPLIIAIIALLIGCGKSVADNPVQPCDNGASPELPQTNAQSPDSRYLLGYWNVEIEVESGTFDITPVRTADFHLNAVRFLEVNPCSDCLIINNIVSHPPNRLVADVRIRHPYHMDAQFSVFDLRGIVVTKSDFSFPECGRVVAWEGSHPRLTNADGHTSLYNPMEYPESGPGPAILKYIPGKWANSGDLSATLNPFVAFEKSTERRLFGMADPVSVRAVELKILPGPVNFGYAVDASWMYLEEVSDPWNDFPPEANCPEAYEIRVELEEAMESWPGFSTEIYVDVFDHQGLDTIESVTIESPQLFGGIKTLDYQSEISEDGFRFTGTIANEFGAGTGEYPLLVRVEDTGVDPNLGPVDAWYVHSIDILDGWATTWGTSGKDIPYALALDADGSIYVAGRTFGMSGEAMLGKVDSDSNFEWMHAWGGYYQDFCNDVATDGKGNVYVTGRFADKVDFDPGPSEDSRTAEGDSDVFLSRFNSNGDFVWVRTWGAEDWSFVEDVGYGVAVDGSGGIYVTGCFADYVDFDPGPGECWLGTGAWHDVFLTKFNTEGEHQWAKVWGDTGVSDIGYGIASDGVGNVYVAGCFEKLFDFDTGNSVDTHESNGKDDAFLSKFNSDGEFQWARTWGGLETDRCHSVALNQTGGVLAAGEFRESVDMNPGDGEEIHDADDGIATFITRFDGNGIYLASRTWGPLPACPDPDVEAGWEPNTGIAFDNTGNIYVLSYFQGMVDFDPGPDSDPHNSNGYMDAYLIKFDPDLNYIRTLTWGGSFYDRGYDIAVSPSGNVYVTGYFEDTVDFNPGPEYDFHTAVGSLDFFLTTFEPDGTW